MKTRERNEDGKSNEDKRKERRGGKFNSPKYPGVK
jgi:hypothetical protein